MRWLAHLNHAPIREEALHVQGRINPSVTRCGTNCAHIFTCDTVQNKLRTHLHLWHGAEQTAHTSLPVTRCGTNCTHIFTCDTVRYKLRTHLHLRHGAEQTAHTSSPVTRCVTNCAQIFTCDTVRNKLRTFHKSSGRIWRITLQLMIRVIWQSSVTFHEIWNCFPISNIHHRRNLKSRTFDNRMFLSETFNLLKPSGNFTYHQV
jgi:hypothetical protein